MWLSYLCHINLLLGLIQATQYEDSFSDLLAYQKKLELLEELDIYKQTLKTDEQNLRATIERIRVLKNEINEKLSVKSKSINQYVECTEKRLKYENRAKQIHELILTMDYIERRYHVYHSKTSSLKRCYRNQSAIYRKESPKGQQKNCNSYTGLNQRGFIDLQILMKLQRSYIDEYNKKFLAHNFMLGIINELKVPSEIPKLLPFDEYIE
ncbi:unnamed protein product [Schistosoma rodhaini]|uniref:Uncharacterized protein n=1 Tax=Schistosoma rodhaini TaxID=6188 RepID=A0AA85G801_9TREM|nr:unnamed protein product [Schistosoma rodhaini]